MKKLFFFAIAVIGMTAACQKQDNTLADESNEPVAIQFGMNAPTSVSVTKTKAPVESWTANTGNIHVVGYNNVTKDLLWVETGTPETSAATANLKFNKPLYYQSNLAYDFRAYYLGDDKTATSEPTLTVPVTITGQEDVMAGVTNRSEDLNKKDEGTHVEDYQIYSAFAARRGVHPSLTFSHMLTRLNVTIEYPAEENRAEEEELQVTLHNLTVTSNTTGNLSLASNPPTLDLNGESKELSITISDENTGVVMIQPNLTELNFTFDLKATVLEQKGQKVTLKASEIKEGEATKFEAGKEYNVTIKVYDLEEIVVSATVSEWDNGGNVTYDPDDDNWTPEGYTPQN